MVTRGSAAKSASNRGSGGRGVSGVDAELPQFPPKDFPLEMTLIYVLTNLFTRMFKLRVEQKLGITMLEWRVIDSIANAPGMIAKQFIDYFGLDKTLLSRTLFKLEATGMIEQRPSKRDRRVNTLHLTDSGKQIYKRTRVAKDQMLAEVCEVISHDDFEAFKVTAERMIEYLRGRLIEEERNETGNVRP
jgi:DNA-binding MarR family transcriptional regulator